MAREVELKFLNIDVPSIKKRLAAAGAMQEFDSDVIDTYLEQLLPQGQRRAMKTVRIRTLDGRTYVTHKGPAQRSRMKVREEYEIQVLDREGTIALFKALGFKLRFESRKHRIHYTLGDASFEIDTYPDIPTYLEAEAHSERALALVCAKLGLRVQDGSGKSLLELYPRAQANRRIKR